MASPSLSEDQIQRTVVQYLNLHAVPFFHPPNGLYLRGSAGQRAQQIAKFKKLGMSPGVPDLVFPKEGGKTAWVEMKTAKGSLSDNQKQWRDTLQALGHEWALCRSLEDVQAFLEAE